MAQKYEQIFFHQQYQFQEANSFLRAYFHAK